MNTILKTGMFSMMAFCATSCHKPHIKTPVATQSHMIESLLPQNKKLEFI